MNIHQIRNTLLAIAATVLVASCGMFGPDELPLSVDPVDEASLSGTASTDDFGTLSEDAETPDTEEEAIELLSSASGEVDGSSVDSSIMASSDESDPFEEWLDENGFTYVNEDDRFVLSGSTTDTADVGSEEPFTSGEVDTDLELDLFSEVSESETEYSFDSENTGSLDIDVTETIRAEAVDDDWVELDGHYYAAANVNAAMESERDDEDVEYVRLAYAASLGVSAALTVEAEVDGEHRGANMLLTVDYGDDIYVEADDFEQFESELFDRIDESEYDVTLAVYDRNGNLEHEWDITVDTLRDISANADFAVRVNEALVEQAR